MKANPILILFLSTLVACNGSGGSGSEGTPAATRECNMNLGDPCGGGLYVGQYLGQDLAITPSGCTDSATPICSGTADTVTKKFQTTTYGGMPHSGGSSLDDGMANTVAILLAIGSQGEAASFCANLEYGGFDDWYLPAYSEFIGVFNNVLSEPAETFNLLDKTYWTSRETGCVSNCGWALTADVNGGGTVQKDFSHYVRCFRKI